MRILYKASLFKETNFLEVYKELESKQFSIKMCQCYGLKILFGVELKQHCLCSSENSRFTHVHCFNNSANKQILLWNGH
jgi:hypothetical protein